MVRTQRVLTIFLFLTYTHSINKIHSIERRIFHTAATVVINYDRVNTLRTHGNEAAHMCRCLFYN